MEFNDWNSLHLQGIFQAISASECPLDTDSLPECILDMNENDLCRASANSDVLPDGNTKLHGRKCATSHVFKFTQGKNSVLPYSVIVCIPFI